MPQASDLSMARFWSPRYWPLWLLWLTMRIVVLLPLRVQIGLGRRLGRLLGSFDSKERRAARRNLEICFPELEPAHRTALLGKHFESVGASFVEMGLGWFAPLERLRGFIRVEGREHLQRAMQTGDATILFTAHFTSIEVCCAMFEELIPGCAFMYRPQRNPFIDTMIRRGRSRFAGEQIPRDNIRALLRALRRRTVVAYTPDQSFVGNQGMLLPFFGEPAVTNIVTSKLARITGARVLTYFFRRLPDDSGYVVNISPPLQDFPSDDPVQDTRRLIGMLEDYIRLAPEQYLWTYRRFKGRPAPYADPYREPAARR